MVSLIWIIEDSTGIPTFDLVLSAHVRWSRTWNDFRIMEWLCLQKHNQWKWWLLLFEYLTTGNAIFDINLFPKTRFILRLLQCPITGFSLSSHTVYINWTILMINTTQENCWIIVDLADIISLACRKSHSNQMIDGTNECE